MGYQQTPEDTKESACIWNFWTVTPRADGTFQTSEQLPDSVSAQSTKHKQQARRTDVMRQATNRDGIQLCVKTLQVTMKTTQAVKCRRLARPKSLPPKKKTLWNVPATNVMAVTRKKRKNSQKKQKLTGSSPRTHGVSALEASSSRNCRCVRPSPDRPDDARRHRLVCRQVASSSPYEVQACFARNAAELLTLSGTGQAQRAEILPFRKESGRFMSQRGCVVKHYQL